MPNQATGGRETILASFASSLLAFVRARKLPEVRFYELATKYGERPENWHERDRRVPLGLVREAWEWLAETCPGPIGLEMAQYFAGLQTQGPVGIAAALAPDLKTGLEVFVRYQSVLRVLRTSSFRMQDTEIGSVVHIDYDYGLSFAIPRIVEFAAALTLLFARELSQDSSVVPRTVQFAHTCVGMPQDYRQHFGVDVSFAAANNAMTFDPATLATVLPTAKPEVLHYLRQHLERVKQQLEPQAGDALAEVRRAVAEHAARGEFRGEIIAKSLGVSLRSLQRRVHASGTSLRALVDETRLVHARELLTNAKLSTEEVAFLLGYSELRSFNRAFKRWTGRTPAQFRRGKYM